MALKFRLYDGGGVQFVEPRVTRPITFAHVSDLHMAPDPPDLWPKPYRRAVEWWAIEMKWPGTVLPQVLEQVGGNGRFRFDVSKLTDYGYAWDEYLGRHGLGNLVMGSEFPLRHLEEVRWAVRRV